MLISIKKEKIKLVYIIYYNNIVRISDVETMISTREADLKAY